MTKVVIDIRDNGNLIVIDGYSRNSTIKGVLKDLFRTLQSNGYDEKYDEDYVNLIGDPLYEPCNKIGNCFTFFIELFEEGGAYVSHSFVPKVD